MTPKEKAKELVKKYNNYVSAWSTITHPNEEPPQVIYEGGMMKFGRAKQCALIAVDEIIKYSGTSAIYATEEGNLCTVPSGYWEEVKQEIRQL